MASTVPPGASSVVSQYGLSIFSRSVTNVVSLLESTTYTRPTHEAAVKKGWTKRTAESHPGPSATVFGSDATRLHQRRFEYRPEGEEGEGSSMPHLLQVGASKGCGLTRSLRLLCESGWTRFPTGGGRVGFAHGIHVVCAALGARRLQPARACGHHSSLHGRCPSRRPGNHLRFVDGCGLDAPP